MLIAALKRKEVGRPSSLIDFGKPGTILKPLNSQYF